MVLTVSLAISLCGPPAQAAPAPPEAADAPLAEAWVTLEEAADLHRLEQAALSLDGVAGDRVRAIGALETFEALERAGFTVEVVARDHRLGPPEADGYHSTEAVLFTLEDLARDYPERATLVDLGESVGGRDLVALRIDRGPVRVRLLGTYHGNETSSTEVALATARLLLDMEPIPDLEVWLMPLVNPDGHAAGSRYNDNGIDLNRNHDYEWSPDEFRSGDGPFTEPETRAVRDLTTYSSFMSGLTMHSGALCIGYSWGFTSEPAADEEAFLELHDVYGEANGFPGFDEVGIGYSTWGDTNDWAYGRHGTLDFTVEISTPYSPPEGALPAYVANHWSSIEAFLRTRPTLQGTVVDAQDGTPLEASITPEGRRPSLAGSDGVFARLLVEESGLLTVSAPGYRSEQIPWEAHDEAPLWLDVELEPTDLVDLRPDPPLLPWQELPVAFALAGVEDPQIQLWRPGYPTHTLARVGDVWPVVTSRLAPGPWGITTSQGSSPRALFVEPWQQGPALTRVEWKGDRLEVEGQGFGRGSRAWVLGGAKRGLTPCPVLEESSIGLILDASEAAGLEGPVDLLVFTDGAQLVALELEHLLAELSDLGEDGGRDQGQPAEGVTVGGWGCDVSQGAGAVLAMLGLLSATLRRRRSRGPR